MVQHADPPLCERDLHARTPDQAAKPRARAHGSIDRDNAAEELESSERSERREIESRLDDPLIRLLKWARQPARRSSVRRGTITEHRHPPRRRIQQTSSLDGLASEILYDAFVSARRPAASETGLAENTFPPSRPFRLDDILDPDFYPDGE